MSSVPHEYNEMQMSKNNLNNKETHKRMEIEDSVSNI